MSVLFDFSVNTTTFTVAAMLSVSAYGVVDHYYFVQNISIWRFLDRGGQILDREDLLVLGGFI